MISSAFVRFLAAALLATAAGALFAANNDAAAKSSRELVAGYVSISKALAADDLKGAQTAAAAMARQAEASKLNDIAAQARAIAEADDIAKSRAALRPLTAVIEPLAANEKDVTVMYCPMARGTWIQTSGPVANPYYGAVMLRCGGPKAAQK